MHDRPLPSSAQAPLRTQPTRMQGFVIQAAAACLLALVIGSLALVCSSCRPTAPGPALVGTSHPTATIRPTLVAYHPGKSLGTLVYSTTFSDTDIFGLAWSPDSTRLGVAAFSTSQSWVATTGKGVVNYRYGVVRSESSWNVPVVVWSPDGKLVAVTGEGPGVQLYDARTGVLVKAYPDTGQAATVATNGGYLSAPVPLGCGGGAGATAWSSDGQLMATAFYCLNHDPSDAPVQVWKTGTGQLVYTYTGRADGVGSLSWSADGTSVASADAVSIQVWNALTGQRIYDFEKNTTCTTPAVAWSPDGKYLAYLSCDQVRVVNPFTGQLIRTHTGPHDSSGLSALAWSPDGKSIASAGDDVEMWSVATGRTYYTFTKNASPIKCLAWSPDGKSIASANTPQPPPYTIPVTIQVWSAE
jgi:WD40 repeat protein